MNISVFGLTDKGAVRQNNEDSWLLLPDLGDCGSFAAVADGMGGPEAGEVASSIVCKTLSDCFSHDLAEVVSSNRYGTFLEECIRKANGAILHHVEENPATIGMGTTVVALWLQAGLAHIAWVGDSRCYVYNPKSGLKALTRDHSYVEELVEQGIIPASEALLHPDSHVITRGLGDLDVSPEPEYVSYSVQEGDMFLLCSDGLCGYVRDVVIEQTLSAACRNTKKACRRLLELAMDAGGEDNITVVLLSTAAERPSAFRQFFRNLPRALRLRP